MVILQGFAQHPLALGWAGGNKESAGELGGMAWRERLGAHLGKVGFRLIGSVA